MRVEEFEMSDVGSVQQQADQGEPIRYVIGPDGEPLIGADGQPIIDRRRPMSERRPANPRVSVVVPAKNEAGESAQCFRTLFSALAVKP